MTNGVLLFAFNNETIDYVKQAVYCAKQIKRHLDLPVQIVTNAVDYIETEFPFYKKYIEHVTYSPAPVGASKTFYDGIYHNKKLTWKNSLRDSAYDLTLFDKTLVLDTDLLVGNNKLLKCFNTNEDFMIAKDYNMVNTTKQIEGFDRVSDRTIPMYWATILYFTKSKTAKTVFDLASHIRENYNYYRLVYDIQESKFRNDFAFSIAVHIMRGFTETTDWPMRLPTDMWVSTDRDVLLENTDGTARLLAQRDYDYLLVKLNNATLHVMNKFSLNKVITGEFENE
jgi:hypothetical protein